ncbi:hypothetical protein [Poseidonibacter lekithochrous]|uniref:hypothetical protein n=1 Tax=Poseidonibacter lekithochrous TaxID=1904463 RepID=UPI0008FC63DE|nr:hypothetical protein [Poseidonibacter lekithochrous]QKJ22376.1 hypothetical protein ALEK_1096 [Poseidonibacter lekithochrous]
MKQLLSIFLVTFIFIGCAPKKTVEISIPSGNNVDIGKPVDKIEDLPVLGEKIEALDEAAIEEDETAILENKEVFKIAFIYPSKVVGKYAKTAMNTMLGYFEYKKINYDIKVFDSLNEDPINVNNAFSEIRDSGFTKVIALFSPKAVDTVHLADTYDLDVYLPLTNKNDVFSVNDNFIYGGISYDDQISRLLAYSNVKNSMFYQNSFLSKKLKFKYENIVDDIKIIKEVKKKRNNFKNLVDDERLNGNTIFLNTGIVKTSILLSQLRAYEIEPRVVLSTQVNYNSKLIALTQKKDRLNFIVANSIDHVDSALLDTLASYGSDVVYNWVDYSTLVGINYLYDSNETLLISTVVNDNEVVYVPKLFKSTAFGFLEIK